MQVYCLLEINLGPEILESPRPPLAMQVLVTNAAAADQTFIGDEIAQPPPAHLPPAYALGRGRGRGGQEGLSETH